MPNWFRKKALPDILVQDLNHLGLTSVSHVLNNQSPIVKVKIRTRLGYVFSIYFSWLNDRIIYESPVMKPVDGDPIIVRNFYTLMLGYNSTMFPLYFALRPVATNGLVKGHRIFLQGSYGVTDFNAERLKRTIESYSDAYDAHVTGFYDYARRVGLNFCNFIPQDALSQLDLLSSDPFLSED